MYNWRPVYWLAVGSLLLLAMGCSHWSPSMGQRGSAERPEAQASAQREARGSQRGSADRRAATSAQATDARQSSRSGRAGRSEAMAMKASSGPSRLHTNGPGGQAAPMPGNPNNPGAPAPQMNGRHQTRPLQLWGQLADGRPHQWEGLDAARNVQQMTSAGEGADFDPVFDPTSGTLVFASTRHRRTADLYRTSPGGQALTQLTSDPANDLMPTVGPDGEKIAFASDRSGNWDIYLMDASGGGNVIRVTSNAAHDLHPSFSPDGNRLVYSSYSQRAGQWQLVVRELDTHGSRTILGEGLFPVWAPDSDRILYQRARQRGTRWFSVWSIGFEDGQAGAPTELAASQDAALITPTWGPSGEKVVFCTVTKPTADKQTRPRRADLWMMEADGSHRTRLTGGRFANLQPTWGANGKVYFVSNRGKPARDGLWSLTVNRMSQPATEPAAGGGPDEQGGQPAGNQAEAGSAEGDEPQAEADGEVGPAAGDGVENEAANTPARVRAAARP